MLPKASHSALHSELASSWSPDRAPGLRSSSSAGHKRDPGKGRISPFSVVHFLRCHKEDGGGVDESQITDMYS